MNHTGQKAKLLVGNSEGCADFLWATRFDLPDPTPLIEIRGKRYLLLNDLEYGRGLKEAKVNQVFSLGTLREKMPLKKGGRASLADYIVYFLKQKKIRTVQVPSYFSVLQAEALKKKGIQLEIVPGPFFPERARKSQEEKKALQASLKATADSINLACKILGASRIQGRYIDYQGRRLTSEILRSFMEEHLFNAGYLPHNTIVAGGRQGADPHCRGSGPLLAHYPIVLDVFPRSKKTGYFGDMTRTVVKGRPSETIEKIYRAVQKAQHSAIKKIKAGIKGETIHFHAASVMQASGFKTARRQGIQEGFIHGLGHGLGLEIHEPPGFRPGAGPVKVGEVITVEPGLYYQDLGGVRLEDVIFVTKKGCELLSHCPQFLKIT